MGPDKPLRPLRDSCHLRDGETGGVAEKQAVCRYCLFQLLIYLLLDIHHLDDHLYDYIRLGCCLFEVEGRLYSAQNCVHIFLGLFPFFHVAAQVLPDRIHPCIDEPLLYVSQGNLKTCLGAHLRNAASHQTGS